IPPPGFSAWLVLALLSTHFAAVCEGSAGGQQHRASSPDVLGSCLERSRTLLANVTNALGQKDNYEGFNCSQILLSLDITNGMTVKACEPDTEENTGCSGHRKTPFNKSACLGNISIDLWDYKNELLSYKHANLEGTLIKRVDELLECLSSAASTPNDSFTLTPAPQTATLENNFENRERLCKVLKAFRVRIVTISRVLSYIKLSRMS
ncbi:interleukin-12 subunit alpha, partial [Lepisosteus oculatus]|uniref:interleukin-12 subunit alpha n=1 Tax=Lepisosteus oculatus TaxID=7918 RepID=UPI0035F51899